MESQGGFLITRVKQVGGRVFERILAERGVEAFNGAQGRILYVLWQGDGVPISALSRDTGLAMTTLTGMLDRMEAAGLILRERSDPGRPAKGVHTADGRGRGRCPSGFTTRWRGRWAKSTTRASAPRRSRSSRAISARVLSNVEARLARREG